jgi:uncharacterized lipoprotein YmbA
MKTALLVITLLVLAACSSTGTTNKNGSPKLKSITTIQRV